MNEYPDAQKLAYEKDTVGIYLSGHPLNEYREYIEHLSTFDMRKLAEADTDEALERLNDDREVVMCAMLLSKRIRTTKTKSAMALLTLEDMYGQFEGALFGGSFERFTGMLETDKPYVIIGKRKIRGENTLSVSIDDVYPMPTQDGEYLRVTASRYYKEAHGTPRLTQKKTRAKAKPVQEQEVNPGPPVTGVRINFTGDPQGEGYQRLLNFLVYFHGPSPVAVSFPDGSVVDLADVCHIDPSPAVIRELKALAGQENVTVFY